MHASSTPMTAYITSTGAFLPGDPVGNDDAERILGMVGGRPSRLRKRIQKANGIRTRHYAIDDTHTTRHTVAGMGADAARTCMRRSPLPLGRITLLSCATTQGDLLLPGLASLIQAELGVSELEINSSHGICSGGLMAMKYAANAIRLGDHASALVVVSEIASRLLKSSHYEAAGGSEHVDFDCEFLRWMLSDGAGALLIENRPRGTCLRIDWIRSFSHADAFPVCMSVGSPRPGSAAATWQDFPTYAEAEANGALLIRQDVRLLDHLVKLGVDGALRLIEEGMLDVDALDHFLCHYSSHHFRGPIAKMLTVAGAMIPESKWYTNLYERGNTGAASILIMLDEFRKETALLAGERILCMVPESGRFNCGYMHLTVVDED